MSHVRTMSRSYGTAGRPYDNQSVVYLKQLLRQERNVLRVQKLLESGGVKVSYPYLLKLARKEKISLQRGRPCTKKQL